MTEAVRKDWLRYRSTAPGLDWAEAAFVGHRFSPHRHDTYAIGVTTRGLQAFRYRGAASSTWIPRALPKPWTAGRCPS
jgi:hypothetical protein